MNYGQYQIRHMLLSIAIGFVTFCITSYLLFKAAFILLGQLQIDFILTAQLIILFLISSLLGIIPAVFVGRKYYRFLRKPK